VAAGLCMDGQRSFNSIDLGPSSRCEPRLWSRHRGRLAPPAAAPPERDKPDSRRARSWLASPPSRTA